MVNTSFFTDGETYGTATVTSNDVPASTSPSQAPSSFFSNGGVVGEGVVVSNETAPGPSSSNTPSSFFKDGATYDTATATSNDVPANTAPSKAPSSFYPGGTVYDYLAQESDIVSLLQQLAAQTTTNASNSATSQTQAAQQAANAATSAAAAATAVQGAAGTATPIVDGTAAVGTSTKWAHEDHVHPTDTSRASVTAMNLKADKTYADSISTVANAAVARTGDTMTGRLTTSGSAGGIGAGGTSASGLWVMSGGTDDAFLTFHRPGFYAVNLGLASDGNLWYGGWSAGAGVAYRLWTTKDFNYTPVNKAGDTMTGALVINAGAPQARLISGGYGAMHHQDGASYYILLTNSGDPLGTYNSLRPFYINLATGNVTMQQNVTIGGDVQMSSNLSVGGPRASTTAGDVSIMRTSSPTTGVVFLGNSGARYLYYDGANYTLAGASVYSANGRLWGTNDVGQIVQSVRMAYVADYSNNANVGLAEPYAGAVITGFGHGSVTDITRYRYLQYQLNGGGWVTAGYV